MDQLAAQAYGWPANLAEEDMLGRLVTLNRERGRQKKKRAWCIGYGPSCRRPERLSLSRRRLIWAKSLPQRSR